MTVRSASYSLVIAALAFASMGGDCTLGHSGPSTVRPPPCDERPKPVMFQAEAGCGPGGQIVVESSTQYPQYPSWINISNARALGLPPSSDDCGYVNGGYQGQSFKGDGGICPIRWDEGRWQITAFNCADGGGYTLEMCSAVLDDGGGTFTCQPSDGGAPCTSRLTVVGDSGTD